MSQSTECLRCTYKTSFVVVTQDAYDLYQFLLYMYDTPLHFWTCRSWNPNECSYQKILVDFSWYGNTEVSLFILLFEYKGTLLLMH